MGGKINPRIRLTSSKDLVEVEAELGKNLTKGGGGKGGRLAILQKEKQKKTWAKPLEIA